MNMHDILRMVGASTKGESRFRQLMGLSSPTKTHARIVRVLIAVSITLVFGMMLFFLGLNYLQLELMGAYVGVPGLSWVFGSFAAGLMTFIFALFSSGTILYHGEDLRLLLTLPVTQSDLLASRLLLHYRMHFMLHAFIFLPAQIVCLFQNGLTVAIAVSVVFQTVFIPFLPISLSLMVIHIFLRRSSSGGRGRESWAVGIMIFLLVIVQGLASRWLQSGFDASSVQKIAETYGTVLLRLRSWLFFNTWLSDMALRIQSLRNLVLTAALVLASILSALLLMKNEYVETVQRLSEMSVKARAHNGKRNGRVPAHGVVGTLVRREFAVLNNHSAFRMELYAEACIPVILVVVYAISGTLDQFSAVADTLSKHEFFPFIVCGILLMMASFSMMSSTSFSREGKLLEASRTLPVEPATFIKAKLLAHLLLFHTSYVVFVIAASFLFALSFVHVLWMIPLGFLILSATACLGLAIDARQPRLDWKLPQQAVKQNMNGMLAMGVSLVLLGIFAAFAYLLKELFGLGTVVSALALLVPGGAVCFFSYTLAVGQASKLYAPQ